LNPGKKEFTAIATVIFDSCQELLTLWVNHQKRIDMINTEIRYDGKKYKEINDAGIQAGVDEINKFFDGALQPFQSEISEHGGLIVVNIKKDFDDAEISFHNLPEKLVQKITSAINE